MRRANRLEGYVDDYNGETVGGWAWDREQPNTPIRVEICEEDTPVATIAADEVREDLLREGIGNGRHGFTYALPEALRGQPFINARFAGTDLLLQNCPRFSSTSEPTPPDGTGLFARARNVTNIDNCVFYHTMDIPGFGLVEGEWDLRHTVREYLGPVQLRGKRVLDVGKGSGFLTFYMESQGAEVVAYDLSEYQAWDVIPYAGFDYQEHILSFRSQIWRLNSGFWLAHRANRSRAKLVHGTVYAIPPAIGQVDIAVLASLLLHLRDPFYALENALRLTRETAIIVEATPGFFLEGSKSPRAEFAPNPVTFQPKDTWWSLPPPLVKRFLQVLGFETVSEHHHTQVYKKTDAVPYYTLVARRSRGSPSAPAAPTP
jgi:2-polyprenyl-3-methyl-5-hydroxy-6-metoxy-1,4-benzoquinol methylase